MAVQVNRRAFAEQRLDRLLVSRDHPLERMVAEHEPDIGAGSTGQRLLEQRLARRELALVIVVFAEPRGVHGGDADPRPPYVDNLLVGAIALDEPDASGREVVVHEALKPRDEDLT